MTSVVFCFRAEVWQGVARLICYIYCQGQLPAWFSFCQLGFHTIVSALRSHELNECISLKQEQFLFCPFCTRFQKCCSKSIKFRALSEYRNLPHIYERALFLLCIVKVELGTTVFIWVNCGLLLTERLIDQFI